MGCVSLRRIGILALLCFCCLPVAVALTEPGQQKSLPPDVFLVTIDTLRADHLHCYGDSSIETPAIDALARDGLRFSEAFTPSPITNTSHVTILTGLLPSSHGVTDFAIPLAGFHATWAELLKAKGYHTAAFIGAVILDSNTLAPGLDRGFDFYDNFPQHAEGTSRWGRLERRGMDVVQRAQAWLEAHPAGPHFLWVHLYDPHDPYEPPSPYSSIYKDRLYDGEIAYADAALGKFLDSLKKSGRYNGSIVIVVGDHGEGLGQHREETHGTFLYDATTHVPLIVKLPGDEFAGQTVTVQVRTTDILPTVLDLLHLAPPEGLDGASLRPYFANPDTKERPAYGSTEYPLHFGWSPLRSVRAGGFKLIEAPRPELYDLHADPGENRNLYQSSSDEIREARSRLMELDTKLGLPPLFPPNASLPDPKDKIEEANLLHTAMLAQEDERQQDARAALEKVIALDPHSWTALNQLGEIEFTAGEYRKAAEHLKLAAEARPEDPSIAFLEGRALKAAGDLRGARKAIGASLALAPAQYPARVLLGELYLISHETDLAEDQFDAALLLQPNGVEAGVGMARAQLDQKQFQAAFEQLQALAKADADNAEVFALLAQACRALGKNDQAAEAEQKAILLRGRP